MYFFASLFWISPPLNANVLFCKFVLNLTPLYDQTQGSRAVFSITLQTTLLHGKMRWTWILRYGYGTWIPVLDVDCVKESVELRWSQSEWGDASLWRSNISYVDTRSWILISGITSFRIFTFIFSQILAKSFCGRSPLWLHHKIENNPLPLPPPPKACVATWQPAFFLAGYT
jgi:hypothetical protein